MKTADDKAAARHARLEAQRGRARRWAGVSAIGMALLLLLGAASVTDHIPRSPLVAMSHAKTG